MWTFCNYVLYQDDALRLHDVLLVRVSTEQLIAHYTHTSDSYDNWCLQNSSILPWFWKESVLAVFTVITISLLQCEWNKGNSSLIDQRDTLVRLGPINDQQPTIYVHRKEYAFDMYRCTWIVRSDQRWWSYIICFSQII